MGLRRRLARLFGPPPDRMRHVWVVVEGEDGRFDEIVTWVREGGLHAAPPAIAALNERLLTRRASLEGDVRPTYLRNEIQSIDAAVAMRRLSTPQPGLVLLHRLVSAWRPRWVVELGSAFGAASAAMACAIAENGAGRFDGIELEAWKAELAEAEVRALLGERGRVQGGRIEELLPRLIASSLEPINFVFVDAAHTYDDTMGYHRLLSGALATPALMVYDDVHWSEETKRCWMDVAREPGVTDAVVVGGRWGVLRVERDARAAAAAPA